MKVFLALSSGVVMLQSNAIVGEISFDKPFSHIKSTDVTDISVMQDFFHLSLLCWCLFSLLRSFFLPYTSVSSFLYFKVLFNDGVDPVFLFIHFSDNRPFGDVLLFVLFFFYAMK